MELTVRVMMAGREIDRVTRQHKLIDGYPFVLYRRRDWLVEDGCIHVDRLPNIPVQIDDSSLSAELRPFLDLIEQPHPVRLTDCSAVLRSCFPHVPDAVVISISTLTQLGLQLVAKEVLMDFLELAQDRQTSASSDYLSNEPWEFGQEPIEVKAISSHGTDDVEHLTLSMANDDGDDWLLALQPEQGWDVSSADDSELRDLAERTQNLIGSHVAEETGFHITDLGDFSASEDWQVVLPSTASVVAPEISESALWSQPAPDPIPPAPTPAVMRNSTLPEQQLALIAEKTASLGQTALEVLKYFADNPGDKNTHAEQFTGIPRGMINALLTGTLGRYVKRTDTGGWACHSWVQDVLGVMDGSLK